MPHPPVLIAGAGPTGLVLALSLARRGVPFRLVDAAAGPGEHSRAVVVHARTLEFYGQLGFADEVVAAGVKVERATLREGDGRGRGRELVSVPFGDLGAGLSPYPFPLAYPQDDHERLLLAHLRAAGHDVEWNTRLTDFTQDDGGVTATLERGHKGEGAGAAQEVVRADYLCGCDGAHSAVRRSLALGFPGGTYPQRYFVADVCIAGGFARDLVVGLGEHAFALLLPVRSTGMQRLIGIVPPHLAEVESLGFDDLRGDVQPLVGVEVTEVHWFSAYRVHHRVAERFRVGRAFVLGDAGHLHSPAGGQGMNTGIGDAVNLAWKLAMVAEGRAAPALLDTYEAERIGFARTLVATTDRAFTQMVAGGLRGEFTRRVAVPLLFAAGTRFPIGRHAFFRTVSQTQIEYEESPLSAGRAGHVRGGDRLPWLAPADGHGTDNFAPLRSMEWQVHVYGAVDVALRRACEALGLAVHGFAWGNAAADAGLARDAAYLVRPDGHVALAWPGQQAATLQAFVDRWRLRFAGAATA